MKTEIVTAIIVLALVASFAWQHERFSNVQLQPSNLAQTTVTQPGPQDSTVEPSSDVAQNPNNQLVRRAAENMAQLPPLESRLRFTINLFGERISGPGRYYQKGQGTRLARIEFQFGGEPNAVQLHQFCDGDFLYSLSIVGKETKLEYVDLRQLDQLATLPGKMNNVSSWLSVGSLSGLLNQLAQHFDFGGPVAGQLNATPVVQLSGRWKPRSLARMLEGQVNPLQADGRIDWSKIPPHVPHQVQLTLGREQPFPGFPYRIVFQKLDVSGAEPMAETVAELELYEPRPAPNLADAMFQLPSVDVRPEDTTDFYQQRIKQFSR